jgi:hypothetical protein
MQRFPIGRATTDNLQRKSKMTPMELSGGCVCGGTRYALRAAPVSLNDCHCVDCRRSAGAPYVTWGSVRRGELQLVHGELREIFHAARFRFFAACCGTPLFFCETKDSEWIDVTIGSLDEPAAFRPEKSIWTEDKLPWVILDPKLPSFPRSSRENA